MWTILLAALPLASVLAQNAAPPAPMTPLERQRLVAHMEMTHGWLEGELAGLSGEQFRFRPAAGAWSILEVLDHLLVAEPVYWEDFKQAMRAQPAGRLPNPADDGLLWYGIDRGGPQKAIPAELPAARLRDPQAALGTLRGLHAEMSRYARTTAADLRAHRVQREMCDAYQWLLLISAHRQRHILQIREIKSHPRFPRRAPR
jgi:hypothetical protein